MAFGNFTLTGQFDGLTGVPATGRVVIDGLPQIIVDPVGNKIRVGPRTVILDAGGAFSVTLSSDVATGTSTAIGYRVTVSLKHQNLAPIELYARAIGSTIDLADVTSQQAAPLTPTSTSGTGAPTNASPNGSTYQRTDGGAGSTLYVRVAGAWTAIA